MRFIIHELPYEVPIASGELHYSDQDQPTVAVEKWRLTEAADGHRFIRVDLDARAAPSRRSYLYHLTVNSLNQPLQLKFRYWKSNLQIIGNVLIEHDAVIVTRDLNGQRYEDVIHPKEAFVFWFPSTIGLGLLAGLQESKRASAVTLNSHSNELEKQMAPYLTKVELMRGEKEKVKMMNVEKVAHPLTISWADQQRIIWLDENNWPIQMQRQDGLIARESRYLSYQRMTRPDPE